MLVNLTPHAVVLIRPDGRSLPFLSKGQARCRAVAVPDGDVYGIPAFRVTYGDVTNLPDPVPGTWYIVSAMVAQAVAPHRPDVLVPHDIVRDVQGNIIGCRGLARAGGPA